MIVVSQCNDAVWLTAIRVCPNIAILHEGSISIISHNFIEKPLPPCSQRQQGGAYTIPFGAGFTFGRRWKVHETCLPRCRLVAAPAPVPAPPRPTLLTARSAAQADIVGQGALAQVIVGHVDGRKVARKVTHDAKRNDELWKEFEILKLVGGHPNIVQVIEFEAKALRHAIVMEMLGPSLLNMLRIPGVAPFVIRDVARSLLSALDHIHGFFGAHCDVSARNLCSRRGWHMVLIDFDSAQIHRSL